jgi:excisionase family DNA binding protein
MNTIDPVHPPKLLWTSREAAKALSISERTLWGLTKGGKVPCVRIGRAVRYDPKDIRAWIDGQKSQAQGADNTPELP